MGLEKGIKAILCRINLDVVFLAHPTRVLRWCVYKYVSAFGWEKLGNSIKSAAYWFLINMKSLILGCVASIIWKASLINFMSLSIMQLYWLIDVTLALLDDVWFGKPISYALMALHSKIVFTKVGILSLIRCCSAVERKQWADASWEY